MSERVPPSVRTGQHIQQLLSQGATAGVDLRSELIKLAVRKIAEEALEAEAADALGRGYYQRERKADDAGEAVPASGYRNGYRLGHLQSAEGQIDFAVPQISER